MNKYKLILGLILIVVGFSAGFAVGWRQSAEHVSKNLFEVFLSTNAYAYSIGLTSEIGMHELITSGHSDSAANFSLYKIDSSIKQIEAINYTNSAFKSEIESSLNNAKVYLNEHPFTPITKADK